MASRSRFGRTSAAVGRIMPPGGASRARPAGIETVARAEGLMPVRSRFAQRRLRPERQRVRWLAISAMAVGAAAPAARATLPPDPVILTDPTYTTATDMRQALTFEATSNSVSLTIAANSLLTLTTGNIFKTGPFAAQMTGGAITSANPGASLFIDVAGGGGDFTLGSAINGQGVSLTKSGAGTLVLTSTDALNDNFAGGIVINSGTVRIFSDANLGANSGNANSVHLNGGTLEVAASVNLSSSRFIGAVPGSTDAGGIRVNANATLTIDDPNQLQGFAGSTLTKLGTGTLLITAPNQIGSTLAIAEGVVELQDPAGLGTGAQKAQITLSGGQLNLRGPSQFAVTSFGNDALVAADSTIDVNVIAGNGATQLQLGALGIGLQNANQTTLQVTGAKGVSLQFNGPVTLNGVGTIANGVSVLLPGGIDGSGSLTKSGSGTLTLLGGAPNTYTGSTTVNGGVLELNKSPGTAAIPNKLILQGGTTVLLAPEQIADSASVAISGGTFNANGQNETIFSLANFGGQFRTGAGVFTVTSSNSTTFAAGSTNIINSGGTLNTSHLKISGGNNLVSGSGLITNLAFGLDFLGNVSPTIMLAADPLVPGRILLGGDVTFTGTDGTALIGDTGGAAVPGQLDLGASNRTFNINDGLQSVDTLITAQVTNGSITKTGPGTLRLAGVNTFAGGVSIQQGAVESSGTSALGTGPISFAGAGAELHLRMDAPLTMSCPNSLTVGAANTITLDIQPGTGVATSTFTFPSIALGSALNITGTPGEKVVFTAATLQNSVSIVNDIDLTLGGAMAGAYTLTKNNAGTLTLTGASPNTFSGATSVFSGALVLSKSAGVAAIPADLSIYGPATVQFAAADQIAHGANVTLIPTATSPTLDLSGKSATISSLSGSGALSLGAGGSLTILRSGFSPVSSFSGTITGTAASLIADGATGSLTLSSHNTYTGTTTLNAGSLTVSADDNLGAPNNALNINSATLIAAGTFSTARPIRLNNAASAIDINGANTLTITTAFSGAGSLTKGPQTGTLLLSAPGTLSLPNFTIAGGNVSAGASTALNVASSMSIATGASLQFIPSGTSSAGRLTHQIGALSIAGTGNLDLGNHEVLTSTAPATIKTYLASAFDPLGSQDWSKTGLTSSFARANPTVYSVGYAYGGDTSAQEIPVSTHGGAGLSLTQTLIRPVLAGDANLDGTVDFFDISQILGYKYNTGQPASYTDGDLDYSGKVDFFDLSIILSSNYNTGQTFGPAALSAPAAAPSLSGSHHAASSASAIASATTIGTFGDGKPDFEYNPQTGDLKFRTDGGTFTTTGGAASFVSSLTIASAAGGLVPGGASAAFAGGTGATITSTLLSSALTNSPGFTDGFDIGLVLAPGLDAATLTADLTVKYQSLNGGSLRASDVIVPEPVAGALWGTAAAAALLAGRRRRRGGQAALSGN
jgi:autotransporter-associated beta strand protein